MINVYMNDSVVIKNRTNSGFGEISTATVIVSGRIERKTKVVKTPSGEDTLSIGSVMLPLSASVDLESFIVVDGIDRRVISIEILRHFSSVFQKVWVA